MRKRTYVGKLSCYPFLDSFYGAFAKLVETGNDLQEAAIIITDCCVAMQVKQLFAQNTGGAEKKRQHVVTHAPGHLVIARETLEVGWWEAVVVERNGDLVTVRYRDYPQYPPMVRHRSAIALISPAAQ
jgi:hypothetical protein